MQPLRNAIEEFGDDITEDQVHPVSKASNLFMTYFYNLFLCIVYISNTFL